MILDRVLASTRVIPISIRTILPSRRRITSGRSPLFLSSAVAWYLKKLDTSPLITKCISSGIASGVGDIACQYIVHNSIDQNIVQQPRNDGAALETSVADLKTSSFWDSFDSIRTSRFAFLGIFLVGPVCHHWYGLLMTRITGAGLVPMIKRTFIDQLGFAPLFIPVFMSSLGLLEGRKFEDVRATIRQEYSKIMIVNWALWVPAMAFNFRFVPGKLQVLFGNAVAIGWNIFLSYESTKWKSED